jgi:hypothetical protein
VTEILLIVALNTIKKTNKQTNINFTMKSMNRILEIKTMNMLLMNGDD